MVLHNQLMVIPGYTGPMKTAISLPDETFNRASRRAIDLGMSRSEFFARAAESYLNDLDAVSVTKQIDESLAGLENDDSSVAAAEAGRRVLAEDTNRW